MFSRALFAGLAIALLMLSLAGSAEAQRRKSAPPDLWCRDMRIGPGPFDDVMVCSAYTYEQCMASRTNFGTCYMNPRYQRRR